MKRIAAIVLALPALFCFGCGQTPAQPETKQISIVTTIFAPYDFARAIAGGLAELTMLLPPGSEAHSFEPTPRDAMKIQACDVFVYVGGESDAWVGKLLDSSANAKRSVVTLMDCVQPLEEEIGEGMQALAEENGGGEIEYDEHVWTSPKNAKRIAEKISAALCEADPANAEAYRRNTEAYLQKLSALDAEFQAIVDQAARRTIVFGDRFPFLYFTRAYGLRYAAAFPGCAAEAEASPATVVGLINKIKADRIPVVFHIELSNEKMARAIAEATGAKVMLFHACHRISAADFRAGKTYLDFMRSNAAALRAALG
ncbi:MAG: metal ABC transporter substrate-binding protein [Oscillospiraceae bacterium]|nr:metal ABC transporter substrate-binding protein [Oscillospiraceae bacterium]